MLDKIVVSKLVNPNEARDEFSDSRLSTYLHREEGLYTAGYL